MGYFRELDSFELELVSGGDYSGEVTVTGYPPYDGPTYDPSGGYTPPSEGGNGDSGSGGTFAENTAGVQIFRHTQNCSTASGAAVQVANHVMGNTGFTQLHASDGSTYNGSTSGSALNGIEFSSIMVNNGDGTYGTWRDQIWTTDNAGSSFIPQGFPGNSVGIWHNHPHRGDDADAQDSYPSPTDWNNLVDLRGSQQTTQPGLDPSLWLTGPDGITREFKLSERSYYAGLTLVEMNNKVGLSGKERTTSCGK